MMILIKIITIIRGPTTSAQDVREQDKETLSEGEYVVVVVVVEVMYMKNYTTQKKKQEIEEGDDEEKRGA
jgi:hypothetical protein